jgi:hypothetical protein
VFDVGMRVFRLVVLLAAAAAAFAGASAAERLHAVDARLCPFPLEIAVSRQVRGAGTKLLGPITVTLRNAATGRTSVLRASGRSALVTATGDLRFSGSQLWLGAAHDVPYLATSGAGTRLAPNLVVTGAARRRVVDPCALVAPSAPSLEAATKGSPWPVPAFALSRIAAAGLSPLLGKPTRHDHFHLDVLVNGRPVTVPAGIGQAEPVDRGPGPCPPPPESRMIGDCAPGHYFTADVAASQLQTHTSSGIVHLQSERRETLRLGQFFDEWGVRFDGRCLGGYCAGGGKELRTYVDGRRLAGDPRKLVLRDGREIAVVFGGPAAFRAVPSRYGKRMPEGCGGPGEHTCFPG